MPSGKSNSSLKMKIGIVKLADVADITYGPAEGTVGTRANGVPAALIDITKTQDANTVDVSERVTEQMDQLKSELPKRAKVITVYDASNGINASVNGMMREGLLGALFAVIVILLFLRNWRATIIAAISIPLSVMIAMVLLKQVGVTLNVMTLGGLTVAIGRVVAGSLVPGGQYVLCRADGTQAPCKLTRVYGWHGLKRAELERAGAGDIVAVAGVEDIAIGDTIADRERPAPLPPIRVDEPTIAMLFGVNTGPWAGRSGNRVTSRQVRERLLQESRRNVSLRVDETDNMDTFRVLGRGELQLAVLIETMRREGFELQVSKPNVVTREHDGALQEPVEQFLVDVPEEYVGVVTQLLGVRRGVMTRMDHVGSGRVRVEYTVPSRGLIGFRSHFLTETRGTATMNALFAGWAPWHGAIPSRTNGALVSDREGVATPYALFHLEERGRLFIPSGTPVYEGMVVGEYSRDVDLDVNVCREKKLTNIRASGHDDAVRLSPHHAMGLEDSLAWIDDDELVEVTPDTVRLRKRELRAALRPKGPRAPRAQAAPAR